MGVMGYTLDRFNLLSISLITFLIDRVVKWELQLEL